jgi:alanine-glyoxylate transaminase/(R)-3-amino-2-methylpropionate-pyruvate transaminase
VLSVIRDENLIENARTVGARLHEGLKALQQEFAIIGDVRGRGFMQAIELVRDRTSKEPAVEETAWIFEKTREHGLIVSKSGNFKNVLRMVPPLCLSMEDVEPVIAALRRCFRDFERDYS